MRTGGSLLFSLVLAVVGCKTEGSSELAGRYILDREAMKARFEASLEGMPAEQQKLAREVTGPMIEAVEVELELDASGAGAATTRRLGLDGEKTIQNERTQDFTWSVRPDGKVILDGDDGAPSTCSVQGSTMTCVTEAETQRTLVFVRP